MSLWTGEALQDLRYELGKTVGEMADLLAVSEYTLRDYEAGRSPIRVAIGMLAAALAEGWLSEEQLTELRRQVEHWDPEAELPGPRRTPRSNGGANNGKRPAMPERVYEQRVKALLKTVPKEAREAAKTRLHKSGRGREAKLAREEARWKRLAARREAAEALLGVGS